MFSSYKRPVSAPERYLDHSQLINLINSLSDGFLATSGEGTIELCNSIALDLLDSNSLMGQNLYQALRLTDKNGQPVDLAVKLAKAKGSLASRDWKLKLSDGSSIFISLSASPIRGGFGNTPAGGYSVLLRDISREKNLEDERDEFVGVASHELRTPVTIAEGNLSNAILLAERSRLPDTILHSLKSAHEQLIFLSSLINDLAMLARADRGKIAAIIEDVNVAELLKTLVSDYQTQALNKGLELKADIDPKISKVASSQLYIREIMQNFITNAIKYTDSGTITLSVKTSLDGIELSVADSGIGIDPVEQAKLFTKFFRSEDFRVRQISGTGLGLYVSAKLAKLLGGYITMASQLNKGSTFSLRLPTSTYRPISPENK
jgi:signal transduction histidine kinase